MNIEIEPAHLDIVKKVLSEIVPDAEVWAYGSRVEGTSHRASDLDLVLRNPQNLTQPQKHLSRLIEAFSQSDLPILIDVLDWALLPQSFQERILQRHEALRGHL